MTTAQDLYKPVQAAIIELFTLDCTIVGQGVLRFCAQTNMLGSAVIFNGNTFTPLPIIGSGWSKQTGSSAPRPVITVSNVNTIVQSVVYAAGDIAGSQLTRQRVYATYLDAVNFPGGVNANADPAAILSTDIYVVDRVISLDKISAQFELCWQLDRPGIMLPQRLALRDQGFPGLGLNAP